MRKIDSLQIRLLELNATLRLKVLYAKRLEHVVSDRNKRIDSLYGLLEMARRQNAKLEAEADHLAQLVADDRRSDAPNESTTFAPQDAAQY